MSSASSSSSTSAKKKRALLVGSNYLATPSNSLYGCINDVVNMKNVLVDAYGYDRANITVLRDDANDAIVLPTRANILNELRKLVLDSANCSEIWFHYSGHGSQIRDINGDEVSGGGMDEVIVPCDFKTAGIIVDDDLRTIFSTSKCPTLLFFDSCHSGTIVDLQYSYSYNSATRILSRTTASALAIPANPRIFCFSGCRDEQTSADAYNAESQQACGAFTNAVIEAMRWNRHFVPVVKLYDDIVGYMVQTGYVTQGQYPQFSSSSAFPAYVLSRSLVGNPNNVMLSFAQTGAYLNTKGVSSKATTVTATPTPAAATTATTATTTTPSTAKGAPHLSYLPMRFY